jgi:hypothetical protein
MKISVLPDKTRMQTVRPYVDNNRYKATVMAVTATRGCERGVIDINYYKDDIENVWVRIHQALVRAVCELKHVDISAVANITDPNQTVTYRKGDVYVDPQHRPKQSGLFRFNVRQ